MQTLQNSIEIHTTKEKVWETLWSDETLRDWASIIDEGTYMDGALIEGGTVNFLSASGYGVASKVVKLLPNSYVSFIWTEDLKTAEDGSLEKRDTQWTGGKETYELEAHDGSVKLTLTQDIPEELVEHFRTVIPKALKRVKALSETKNNI